MKYNIWYLLFSLLATTVFYTHSAEKKIRKDVYKPEWEAFYVDPLEKKLKCLRDDFKEGEFLFKKMMQNLNQIAAGNIIQLKLVPGTEKFFLQKAQEIFDTFQKKYTDEIVKLRIIFDRTHDKQIKKELDLWTAIYKERFILYQWMLDDFRRIAEGKNIFPRIVPGKEEDFLKKAAELYAIFYKKHIILIKDAELKIIVAEKERVDKQKVTFGYKKTILLENKPGERKNKYLTKKDEEANKEKSILEKQIAKEEGLDWESWLMKEEERSD